MQKPGLFAPTSLEATPLGFVYRRMLAKPINAMKHQIFAAF